MVFAKCSVHSKSKFLKAVSQYVFIRPVFYDSAIRPIVFPPPPVCPRPHMVCLARSFRTIVATLPHRARTRTPSCHASHARVDDEYVSSLDCTTPLRIRCTRIRSSSVHACCAASVVCAFGACARFGTAVRALSNEVAVSPMDQSADATAPRECVCDAGIVLCCFTDQNNNSVTNNCRFSWQLSIQFFETKE